jgi:hypothetical protein
MVTTAGINNERGYGLAIYGGKTAAQNFFREFLFMICNEM